MHVILASGLDSRPCRSDRSTSTSPTRPPTRSTTSPRRIATSTTATTSTALEQRRAVRDHRARPVPEPRRHRRVRHGVDRHRAAHGARVARARRRPARHVGRARCRSRWSRGCARCASAATTTSGASAPISRSRARSPRSRSRARSTVGTAASSRTSRRYAQVGTWEGTITVAGRTFEVTPDRWKGARDHSWGVRPVGEPEAPGHQGARTRRTATGSATTGCRCSSTTTCSRCRSTRTPTATDMVEESVRVWNFEGPTSRSRTSAGPRSTSTTCSGHARDARRDRHVPHPSTATATIAGHEHAAAHAVPRRGFGLREPRRLGSRLYQGPLTGRGPRARPVRPRGAAQRTSFLNETLCRFELDTGEVGYGMHENLLVGIYRPTGFLTPDAGAVVALRRRVRGLTRSR